MITFVVEQEVESGIPQRNLFLQSRARFVYSSGTPAANGRRGRPSSGGRRSPAQPPVPHCRQQFSAGSAAQFLLDEFFEELNRSLDAEGDSSSGSLVGAEYAARCTGLGDEEIEEILDTLRQAASVGSRVLDALRTFVAHLESSCLDEVSLEMIHADTNGGE